jgi:5-methyltetrahydropteroyltriglutamate--homocysteine methyltransferase
MLAKAVIDKHYGNLPDLATAIATVLAEQVAQLDADVVQVDEAQLIDYLNVLHVDHVVMETAHRPPAQMAAFRDLRAELGFGLGAIDIKSTEIESADEVARAIERAEAALGPGRIKYVHPYFGYWMLKHGKICALVAGRDLFEGGGAQHDGRRSVKVRWQSRSNGRAC